MGLPFYQIIPTRVTTHLTINKSSGSYKTSSYFSSLQHLTLWTLPSSLNCSLSFCQTIYLLAFLTHWMLILSSFLSPQFCPITCYYPKLSSHNSKQIHPLPSSEHFIMLMLHTSLSTLNVSIQPPPEHFHLGIPIGTSISVCPKFISPSIHPP